MKKNILLGTTLLMVCLLSKNVYATKVDMEVNKTELKPGEEIIINIKLDDITSEEGVNVIQGKLEYNKEVFEKVENGDFSSKNNWSMLYNDEDTDAEGKWIAINYSSGEKESQDIVECTLKVKENPKNSEDVIKLTQIATTENDQMVDIDDAQVKVSIERKNIIQRMFLTWIENIAKFFNKKG